ncbi:MAG TPA: Mur ligase family protein [Ktedonobacteraceae bacterium]|jgi:dihydrofolate synthase/folylpolyglutamate synthase
MYTQNTRTHKTLMPQIIWELVYSSYRRAAEHLHGPDALTRNLDYSRELFALLGIDFHLWPRVNVTGSKGKGSTSVLIASIVQASGQRVGLISSPEMRRFNERIRIDGQCVADDVLLAAAYTIAPAVRSIISRLTPPQYLGPGGVILALGATIFAREQVSALVVEAGRGGEYDEARLIEADVSVLTPVMLEHADKLGATVQDIARTKAAITAPGSPIVTAPQTREVQTVIESLGKNLGSRVFSVASAARIDPLVHDLQGVHCDIQIQDQSYRDLHIPLPGRHQAENAAAAILVGRLLARQGVLCTPESVSLGLQRVRWPGRAQVLQQRPRVLLDGAINRESAAAICELLQQHPARHRIALVCVPRPKDLDGLCARIAPFVEKIVVTQVPAPNLRWYEDAAAIAARHCSNVVEVRQTEEALHTVLKEAGPDDDVLLLGTQSFLGAALHFWDVDTCAIW